VLRHQKDLIVLQLDIGELLIRGENIRRIERHLTKEALLDSNNDPSHAPAAPGGVAPQTPVKTSTPKVQTRKPVAKQVKKPVEKQVEPTPVKKPPAPAKKRAAAKTKTVMVPAKPESGSLISGRLLDRYAWAYGLELSSKMTALAILWFLLWVGFMVGCKVVDIETLSGGRCAASAFLWLLLLMGVSLIPNPTVLIVFVVASLLCVVWIVTARRLLEADWFQTFILQIFGMFTLAVLVLLIEVGRSVLEL